MQIAETGRLQRIEDGAPNGGDGNDDGVPDRAESDFARFPLIRRLSDIDVVGTGVCGRPMNVPVHTEDRSVKTPPLPVRFDRLQAKPSA